MRIRILGKAWTLSFVAYVGGKRTKRGPGKFGDYGQCDDPDSAGTKRIRIREDLRGELLLDTIIHEMLHAANWHIDEDHVNRLATDMARTIMRKAVWERIAAPE